MRTDRAFDDHVEPSARTANVHAGDRFGSPRDERCECSGRELDAPERAVDDEPLLAHAADIEGRRPSISAR